MAEIVRDFRVTVEIYRDTTKQTTTDRRTFDSIDEARAWLDEMDEED